MLQKVERDHEKLSWTNGILVRENLLAGIQVGRYNERIVVHLKRSCLNIRKYFLKVYATLSELSPRECWLARPTNTQLIL